MSHEHDRGFAALFIEKRCKICGEMLRNHTLQKLQMCWYFKELAIMGEIER